MNPFDWAKKRKQAPIVVQSYRRRQQIRQTRDFDDNELGKYIVTLHHKNLQQLRRVADGLAREDGNQEPVSAFGKRSGNEYLGRFKVLRTHITSQLPTSWNDKETVRGLRWLKRLLDIEESDRKQRRQGQDNLLNWLPQGEQATASVQPTPSSTQSTPSVRAKQGGQGKPNRQKRKR